MNKSFGDLLSDSWSEYKLNFKVIFKLFLYFVIIPGIVIVGYQIYGMVSLGTLAIDTENNPFAVFDQYPTYFITSLFLSLISGLLSFLAYVSITFGALRGKKFSFSEALHEGKKNYWRAISYTIVVSIFIILLFMLLIVPGIVFAVYWIFAYFVFLNEKKGIIDSLSTSYNMVKGKWWMTFGYGLLLMLIIIGISIIFSIPSFASGFLYAISAFGNKLSVNLVATMSAVGFLFSAISQLITTPLSIIFMKNFYLTMGKKK